jgi:DNA-binding NtrC family response regulator
MHTVLVVDDEKCIRDALTMALNVVAGDCRVRTAEDGEQAREILDSSTISAVITDIDMPRMNGYQLIEHVRETSGPLPVIVMTAEPEHAVARRLESLGVVRYFEKPFNVFEVVRAIRSAIASSVTGRRAKINRADEYIKT